jgi:hypothetical protein
MDTSITGASGTAGAAGVPESRVAGDGYGTDGDWRQRWIGRGSQLGRRKHPGRVGRAAALGGSRGVQGMACLCAGLAFGQGYSSTQRRPDAASAVEGQLAPPQRRWPWALRSRIAKRARRKPGSLFLGPRHRGLRGSQSPNGRGGVGSGRRGREAPAWRNLGETISQTSGLIAERCQRPGHVVNDRPCARVCALNLMFREH